jgi:mRNA interferase RelE/StbE
MSEPKTYRVLFEPVAWSALMKLSPRLQEQILRAVEALEIEPRPPGVVKLQGRESTYRVRSGDFRVLYEIRDRELVVLVVDIGNRRDVYR